MASDLKRRLRQLERQREESGDVCPECRFRSDDVREITISRASRHDATRPPLPPRAASDVCGTCGGGKTIRVTEEWPREEPTALFDDLNPPSCVPL
jgi:hypothetical protein